MFRLSLKIWWKGVLVFAVLCAILALPTLCLSIVGLIFGVLISVPSILFYAFVIYLLKKSEANSSYALTLLFIATIPAVLIALFSTVLIDNSNLLEFQLNKFYSNPVFYVPWFCAAIGIRFSRKQIHQFFNEEDI